MNTLILLTKHSVADLLAVSPATVATLVRRGELTPVVVCGRHERFRADEIDRYLKSIADSATTRSEEGGATHE